MPGYGFAKVARSVKENWGEMIEAYLRQRTNLALVVLILDIRRVPNEDDLSLRDWLDHYRIPYLYVLTKSDKLSNNQSVKQKRIIEKILNASKEEKLILFSAKTQKGKDDLWKILGKYSNNPKDVICQ